MANTSLMPRPSFAVTLVATGLVALTTGAFLQPSCAMLKRTKVGKSDI